MKRLWLFLFINTLYMNAQEAASQRYFSLGLGGYIDSLSNGYGQWRGLTLEGTYYVKNGGPWIGSIVTSDRHEGKGEVFSLGKYFNFPVGYAFIGAGAGTGANFLPRYQASANLNVKIAETGLLLGGGVLRTEVPDGHRDLLLQAGPTFYYNNFIYTYQYLRNRSDPNAHIGISHLLDLRHGNSDFAPWQSLTLALRAEAYENLTVGQGVYIKGNYITFKIYQPLGTRNGIRATLECGQKKDAYKLIGGQLCWIFLF